MIDQELKQFYTGCVKSSRN